MRVAWQMPEDALPRSGYTEQPRPLGLGNAKSEIRPESGGRDAFPGSPCVYSTSAPKCPERATEHGRVRDEFARGANSAN
jgi:hypothetical protein